MPRSGWGGIGNRWTGGDGGEPAGGFVTEVCEGVETGADVLVELDPGGGHAGAFEDAVADVDFAGEGVGGELDRFAVAGEVLEFAAVFGLGNRFVEPGIPVLEVEGTSLERVRLLLVAHSALFRAGVG